MSDSVISPEGELAEYDQKTVWLISEMEAEISKLEMEFRQIDKQAKAAKKEMENLELELRQLIRERREGRGKKLELHLFNHDQQLRDEWGATLVSDGLDTDEDLLSHLAGKKITTMGELSEAINTRADQLGLEQIDIDELRQSLDESWERYQKNSTPTVDSELWKEFPIARWTAYGLTDADVKKLEGCIVKRTGEAFPIRTVGDLNRFVQPNAAMPEYSRGYADIKGFGQASVDRLSDAEAKFWFAWNGALSQQFAMEKKHGNENQQRTGRENHGQETRDEKQIP